MSRFCLLPLALLPAALQGQATGSVYGAVRDTTGHYVAGINVILQGRLITASDMTERFFRPLHEAAMELGSQLLG